MQDFLHLTEHTLHNIALAFMALVYTIRIFWFLRFKAGRERQGPTGTGSVMPTRSIVYSWANIAMPWVMESTRSKFLMYLQFVIFHLGVTAAILLLFIIPYFPGLLENQVIVRAIQVFTGAACAVGLIRMVRRIGSKYMRAISSPDDYFSLVLLTLWLLSAAFAAPYGYLKIDDLSAAGMGFRLTYFLMASFFLVYVPFSKISHYLYYPFTRYYFGKTMGYRGVYPVQQGAKAD